MGRVLNYQNNEYSKLLSSTRWLNFEQLLKITVSVIADMTFISVLNDHTFYIHFAFAIIFKKNLHMNVAKVDFYFIVIHKFFIGYQMSKLVITQTRSKFIHRVSSFEYPLVQF